MKERGIIFGAHSVTSILADRKTVTRRIVKPPPDWLPEVTRTTFGPGPLVWPIGAAGQQCGQPLARLAYGAPGDRLWVREVWAPQPGREESIDLREYEGGGNPDAVCYRADERKPGEDPQCPEGVTHSVGRWRSPLFMPRWASRITLEVVDVRVERLHDLSEEDAIAEGIERSEAGTFYVRDDDGELAEFASARSAFEFGWDGLHAKRGGWAANPWCWRIEFTRVEGGSK